MRKFVQPGIFVMLSLVMVFGSVNSFSFTPPNEALAADMGDMGGDSGGDDSSDDMPKDAPLTTDALTAGGESDNDDDDDSGGNRDNDNDNDNDNDSDNEPTSRDAPVTTDTLTAKKRECPEGQEVTLFSASCKPAGTDSTGGASSAANSCPPITPTPTSYNDPREMQWSLLHRVADGDVPDGTESKSNQDTEDFGTFGKQSTGASPSGPCPSGGDEPVSETRERLAGGGSMTTSTKQDGTKEVTILNLGGVLNPEGKLVPGAVEQVTRYNAQNKPTRTDSYDRSQNVISTTNYDPKGNPTLTTDYDSKGEVTGTATYGYDAKNRQAVISHFDPQKNLVDKTTNTYYSNGLPRASLTVDGNNIPTSKTIYAGGNTPQSIITYVNGKPSSVTRYNDNGQETETILFGPDGKPIGSGAATSITPPEK